MHLYEKCFIPAIVFPKSQCPKCIHNEFFKSQKCVLPKINATNAFIPKIVSPEIEPKLKLSLTLRLDIQKISTKSGVAGGSSPQTTQPAGTWGGAGVPVRQVFCVSQVSMFSNFVSNFQISISVYVTSGYLMVFGIKILSKW